MEDRVGILAYAASFVALMPSIALADEPVTVIATDRPAVTDSSVVIPQGGFQIESGAQITDSAGRSVWDFPQANLRYGLLPRTEIRVALPDYLHAAGGAGVADGASGFADAAIGVKQQLGPLQGLDVSVIGFVTLPTGSREESTRRYDPGIQLPWSRGLSGDWTLAGQLAVYRPTVNGVRDTTGEVTVLIDRQLTAPWDAFLEYAGDFPQRGGSSQLLHVGTAYKLAPHHQLDLHAGVGLSPSAPRSFVGVGYSFLGLKP